MDACRESCNTMGVECYMGEGLYVTSRREVWRSEHNGDHLVEVSLYERRVSMLGRAKVKTESEWINVKSTQKRANA